MLIHTVEEMIQLGKQLGSKHPKILLYGNVWVGKTHFTKWFVQNHQIHPEHVTSPTYTYLNEYDNRVLHIDMYRIWQSNDLFDKGILDKIDNYDHIIIERPKFESEYIDDSRLKIEISKEEWDTREITFLN